MARRRDDVELVDGLERRLSDAETLHELAREEADDSLEEEIASSVGGLAGELEQLELRALFTGDHDERDAICELHSGAGGTDAQDWTEMLLRMFTRWAEDRGFEVEIDQTHEGSEAGLQRPPSRCAVASPTACCRGSGGAPPEPDPRRSTPTPGAYAFASLDVVPALEDAEQPDIDPKRPSPSTPIGPRAPAGSRERDRLAVRITHCHRDRPLVPERAVADQNGRGRCRSSPPGWPRAQRHERREEMAKISGAKQEAAFGSQIRTYTLAPPAGQGQRTRHETGNVNAVSTATSTRSSRPTSVEAPRGALTPRVSRRDPRADGNTGGRPWRHRDPGRNGAPWYPSSSS